MTIKPVLVPDHTANDLRRLMDHFAEATTGPSRQQLAESRAAVAAAQGVTEGAADMDELRDKMQWLMTTYHMRSGEAEEAAYYDEDPATWKGSPWEDEYTGVTEARPDVMRHKGDQTVKIVKRGGKPVGEIGIDAEASPGNGQYYVKLYDGSYDAAGFDTAEEALKELRYAIKLSMSEGVTEAGAENNPVINAITRRIMLQRTDLLSKYGPEQVGAAVDEVADFVGDVEEIGSSDVSGWIRHVEQMLGNMEPGVTEQQVDELSPKTLGSYIKKSSADAAERQGEVSGRNQFGKGAEFAVKAFYGDRIQPNPTRTDPRIAKRQAGVDQAVDRLTAEDVAEGIDPVEQLRADIRRFSR
jgi:hypothetical protein